MQLVKINPVQDAKRAIQPSPDPQRGLQRFVPMWIVPEVQKVLCELIYVDRRSNREDRPRLDRGGAGEAPLCVQGDHLQARRGRTDSFVPHRNVRKI
jgi:hypothetical protein